MRLLLAIVSFLALDISLLPAQTMVIRPGTKLVMKDNVQLVLHNQALRNDGSLQDRIGTIKFTGHKDSTVSFINGSQPMSIYNLITNKTDFGIAVKSALAVRNLLGVYGGILYPDSNLSLKSDADLTARVDIIPASAAINGKAIVERFYPNRRAWRLITAPLTQTATIYETWQNNGIYQPGINTSVTGPLPSGAGGNGLDISPQNNVSMKKWNVNTQLLENVLNTKVPLSAGISGNADNTGYFIFVRGDRDFNNFTPPNSNITTLISSGQLQTGSQTFTASSVNNGFTLIGNPYASPVDFNLVTRNNLVKRFYVWDPRLNALGAYVMLDDLDGDGVFSKSIAASNQTKDIQSGQAFFVETLAAAAASITFEETHKSAGNNNTVFRPVNEPAQMLRIVLNKPMADGSNLPADGVFVEYSKTFSDAVNSDDAVKFFNINENISIQKNGRLLTAERKPLPVNNDTLFLQLNKTTQLTYQFEFIPERLETPGLEAWLEDSYLKTSVPVSLTGSSTIDFTIDANGASAAANRFRIVFKQAFITPVVTTAANQKGKKIVVEWKAANELNVQSYVVEKSADSLHFNEVKILGINSSNPPKGFYTWQDASPLSGNNFYRIKYHATSGGAIGYSNIANVFIDNETAGFSVYPNPVRDNSINLYLIGQPAGKYGTRLLNSNGQVVYSGYIENYNSSGSFLIQPLVKLPAGIYQLELSRQHKIIHAQQIFFQ